MVRTMKFSTYPLSKKTSNQFTNENEEIMNLRLDNDRLQNVLNTENKTNERMMKSQVDMNQLNEKN